jgi:hypothetical protein
MDLTRGGFFRLGATGVATAAGGMLVGGTAFAAPPPAKPVGDDVGFLTFGVVAERTALTFYKRGLTTPGLFDAAERRRLTMARAAKRDHVNRLNAALGGDAVGAADYEVDFATSSFSTARSPSGSSSRSCSSASTSTPPATPAIPPAGSSSRACSRSTASSSARCAR